MMPSPSASDHFSLTRSGAAANSSPYPTSSVKLRSLRTSNHRARSSDRRGRPSVSSSHFSAALRRRTPHTDGGAATAAAWPPVDSCEPSRCLAGVPGAARPAAGLRAAREKSLSGRSAALTYSTGTIRASPTGSTRVRRRGLVLGPAAADPELTASSRCSAKHTKAGWPKARNRHERIQASSSSNGTIASAT
jgi:hypothetical protein